MAVILVPKSLFDNRKSISKKCFSFGTLYKQDANNFEIYKRSVEPLVELCISGFNCAFITFGESQSGKSFTLSGENIHKQGLAPLAIDGFFSRLSEEFGKGT